MVYVLKLTSDEAFFLDSIMRQEQDSHKVREEWSDPYDDVYQFGYDQATSILAKLKEAGYVDHADSEAPD